ncbi:MAG: RloB domain-containing protein [Neisseriaceae bacterium]
MVKKIIRSHKTERDSINILVLCNGKTENLYLKEELDTRKCKVKFKQESNALNFINLINNDRIGEYRKYNKIYCVFDRDNGHNSDEQLNEANKIIIASCGRLIKVLSNLCFEVVFLFNFGDDISGYQDFDNIKQGVKKKFKIEKYEKTNLKNIISQTDFTIICHNAEECYGRLKINDKNWLINDSYTEIFKLLDFRNE